jgi:hypothetical protein
MSDAEKLAHIEAVIASARVRCMEPGVLPHVILTIEQICKGMYAA